MFQFRSMRLLLGVLGLVSLFALEPTSAEANIITQYSSTAGTPGNYTWSYTANVTSDQTVATGNYFELIDFHGFNGTHSEPAGWAFSTSNAGPIPAGLAPTDDPAVSNLIWTYTGTTPITGPQALGMFTAGSTLNTGSVGTFVAQGTLTSGLAQGLKVANIGGEMLPNSSGFPLDTAAPEPTTLTLLLLSLPVVWPLMRRSRRLRPSMA